MSDDAHPSRSGSFEDFYVSEFRSVLGLAYVLCGDRGVAEELAMGAFETALRQWPRVSEMGSPGGWVRSVVANASVSRFRRLAAERRARIRLAGDRETLVVDDGVSREVWEAVRRLPKRQAQVVALFYFEGYQREETAAVLGISEESVKTHLDRARRRLAKELREHADHR
ncbi:MAG TPA: sigma-70 family RNA polymerase sigma factor [Acidimicrobiia bacterium]|nr:sigma-70 family RNA polymerase sigma factor [Acidimicrobiia bacterium]